jgi:hypothetical protein
MARGFQLSWFKQAKKLPVCGIRLSLIATDIPCRLYGLEETPPRACASQNGGVPRWCTSDCDYRPRSDGVGSSHNGFTGRLPNGGSLCSQRDSRRLKVHVVSFAARGYLEDGGSFQAVHSLSPFITRVFASPMGLSSLPRGCRFFSKRHRLEALHKLLNALFSQITQSLALEHL